MAAIVVIGRLKPRFMNKLGSSLFIFVRHEVEKKVSDFIVDDWPVRHFWRSIRQVGNAQVFHGAKQFSAGAP